jgi:glycosyltransferase involved in cell wall biosynthesis
MNNLSVIVPFYNEENSLKKSIERLLKNDIFDQIILVDDCSTDHSASIANKFSSNYSKITYVKSEDNVGKGNALNIAREFLDTTHVIIHDADLEYFPQDIVEMFKVSKLYPTSLILGSRFIGNKIRKNIYARTLFANKIMSLFFSFIHSYKVTDVATCYKLMPSSFFQEIKIKEKGFSIEIEVLSKFIKWNKSIVEVPISYEGRSYRDGKKIKTMDGFRYLVNTVKYKIFN